MRGKALLGWLLAGLLLFVTSDASAGGFERLLNEASETGNQNTRVFYNLNGKIGTLWCQMDLTAIDTGTLQWQLYQIIAIDTCGDSATEAGDACTADTDCTGDTCDQGTDRILWAAGSAEAAITEVTLLFSDRNKAGVGTASADVANHGVLPGIFQFTLAAGGGATVDYTFDCWWF